MTDFPISPSSWPLKILFFYALLPWNLIHQKPCSFKLLFLSRIYPPFGCFSTLHLPIKSVSLHTLVSRHWKILLSCAHDSICTFWISQFNTRRSIDISANCIHWIVNLWNHMWSSVNLISRRDSTHSKWISLVSKAYFPFRFID